MTTKVETLAMVGFSAGGLRFAVEASCVAAMFPSGSNAVSFAALMGLTPAGSASRELAIRYGETARAIAVEEPVSTFEIPFHAIHPLPPMMAARRRTPYIRALAWDERGLVMLADLRLGQSE